MDLSYSPEELAFRNEVRATARRLRFSGQVLRFSVVWCLLFS